MNGIYEIRPSEYRDWDGGLHVTQVGPMWADTLIPSGKEAAIAVTTAPFLTPSPAINLDGSDMVRMSWPEDREREMAIEREMRMLMRPVDRKVTAHILRDPPSFHPNPEYWANEAPRGSLRPACFAEVDPRRYPGISSQIPEQYFSGLNSHTIQATPTPRTPQPTIPDVIG